MTDEKTSKENNKDKRNLGTTITNFFSGGAFANGLAVLLILGTIVAIIFLVWAHQATISSNRDLYEDIITNFSKYQPKTDEILDSFQIFYRESNAANTNILSILLPVFGAWVGAIIAFYYGNKNVEKLTQNYENTVAALGGLSTAESEIFGRVKIEDVLKEFSAYKNVDKAKMTDKVGDTIKNAKHSILLIDDANKPLGFFYPDDVYRTVNTIDEKKLKEEPSTFAEFIGKYEIVDEITDKKWTPNGLEDGIKNYAEISLSDTLLQARSRMQNIGTPQKVRGLVLTNEKQIVGVITYALFSEVLEKENKLKGSK